MFSFFIFHFLFHVSKLLAFRSLSERHPLSIFFYYESMFDIQDTECENYDPGRRTAWLHKSALAAPAARARFRIAAAGITDP
jgi:hypothetical protein